jgi:hypothetical protein
MSPTIEKIALSGDTLTIREGIAPDILPPQKVVFGGTLNAPADYAEHLLRHEMLDESDSRVEVDEKKDSLTLFHRHSANALEAEQVKGTLRSNPDLDEFLIFLGSGSPAKWTPKALADFLRPRRVFFSEHDEHARIVSALLAYKVSSNTEIATDMTQASRTGSGSASIVRRNAGFDELEFTLAMSPLLGEPKAKFKVQVCFDVRDAAADVWIESLELRDIIEAARQTGLEREVARLKALGLLIVYV